VNLFQFSVKIPEKTPFLTFLANCLGGLVLLIILLTFSNYKFDSIDLFINNILSKLYLN